MHYLALTGHGHPARPVVNQKRSLNVIESKWGCHKVKPRCTSQERREEYTLLIARLFVHCHIHFYIGEFHFYIGVSILNLRLDYIHLVAGNLSRCFLLATNLSPPTSRITHFPSLLSSSWSPRSADTFISFIKFLTPSFILQNEIEVEYQA